MAEVVSEVGPNRLTVALVIGRAGIAHATFYDLFDNPSDALRSALELAERQLGEAIEEGPDHTESWNDRVAALISRW